MGLIDDDIHPIFRERRTALTCNGSNSDIEGEMGFGGLSAKIL
jgi:hypothetical protein